MKEMFIPMLRITHQAVNVVRKCCIMIAELAGTVPTLISDASQDWGIPITSPILHPKVIKFYKVRVNNQKW